MRRASLLAGVALAIVVGCGDRATTPLTAARAREPEPVPAHSFDVQVVASGFRQPVQAISRPGDPQLFVVEQGGTIRALVGDGPAAEPLLDIRAHTNARGEQGLLSAPFTPSGERIVVLFTNLAGDTRVVSYPVVAGRADPSHGVTLLAVQQPYPNHNGGTVLFDQRGRLVVGLGDGGKAYDPGQRAQKPDVPLGGVLRRENGTWKKVVLGLRNPWRMASTTRLGCSGSATPGLAARDLHPCGRSLLDHRSGALMLLPAARHDARLAGDRTWPDPVLH